MIDLRKMGMHFTACTSKNYFPEPELVALCLKEYAKEAEEVFAYEDVENGTKDVECYLYRCMGIYGRTGRNLGRAFIKELLPYKVTKEVMDNAGESANFLIVCRRIMIWRLVLEERSKKSSDWMILK